MSKHTPGPWDNGLDANGRPLIFQQRPNEFMLPHEINEEWQANRALVDAAPDLLEALTELVGKNKRFTGGVWDRARAVIKKAEENT